MYFVLCIFFLNFYFTFSFSPLSFSNIIFLFPIYSSHSSVKSFFFYLFFLLSFNLSLVLYHASLLLFCFSFTTYLLFLFLKFLSLFFYSFILLFFGLNVRLIYFLFQIIYSLQIFILFVLPNLFLIF